MNVIELEGRRRLCFATYGAPDGVPVIALHGTPGSRLKYETAHDQAAALGLSLISIDRWGYGRTDLHPRPTLTGFAEDIATVADRLGIARFAVIGISGGAPYACATAARLGDRVLRLALVSPLGPTHLLSPDEMRLFHNFCFRTLPHIPGLATAIFRFYRRLLFIAPRSAIALASLGSVRTDRVLMRTPTVQAELARMFREGLAIGARGGVLDLTLFSRPWDFHLGDITAPTRIWYGTDDRNVPQAAAARLETDVPGAVLTLLHGEGHFWISKGYLDVLTWLKDPAMADPRRQLPEPPYPVGIATPSASGPG